MTSRLSCDTAAQYPAAGSADWRMLAATDAWERGDTDAIRQLCDEGIVITQARRVARQAASQWPPGDGSMLETPACGAPSLPLPSRGTTRNEEAGREGPCEPAARRSLGRSARGEGDMRRVARPGRQAPGRLRSRARTAGRESCGPRQLGARGGAAQGRLGSRG